MKFDGLRSRLATVTVLAILLAANSEAIADGSAANTTVFGPKVFVFEPTMPAAEIEKTANDVFSKMEKNHFGPER